MYETPSQIPSETIEAACVGSVFIMLSAGCPAVCAAQETETEINKRLLQPPLPATCTSKVPTGIRFHTWFEGDGVHTEPDAEQKKSLMAFHVKTTWSKMSGPLYC